MPPLLTAAARRLAIAAVTLIAASIVIFLALAWLPGDPARVLLGMNAEPEQVAALRQRMGLDRPLIVQYAAWIGGVLQGDLGRSQTYDVPVAELLAGRIALSLPLALLSLALTAMLALPLGLLAAARPGGARDAGIMLGVQVGLAIPNFWLGLLLIILVALGLGWLPAGENCYLWRAVGQDGEILESYVTKTRDKPAALRFLRKLVRRHRPPQEIVTDRLRTYGAAMRELRPSHHETEGRWINNRAENSH